MKRFLSPDPIWPDRGMGIIRILVGVFMFYHGLELFDESKIREYSTWAPIRNFPFPAFLAHAGKALELAGGLLLALGLYSRLGIVFFILPMLFISFLIGNGKIWYEDQYPFLFVLLGMVFFFYGPGAWSLDRKLNKTSND